MYLSFDGLTGEVYEGTCGRDILDVKMRVVERCREAGIQVVLSVAVVAGLNDGQLGDLLRFCLDNADVVAGLALQPAFTSGRFDAERAMPMSAGDVIFQLAEQSDGLLEPRDVWPLGCSNPLCDTGVFFVHGTPPEGVPAHPSGFYPATVSYTHLVGGSQEMPVLQGVRERLPLRHARRLQAGRPHAPLRAQVHVLPRQAQAGSLSAALLLSLIHI